MATTNESTFLLFPVCDGFKKLRTIFSDLCFDIKFHCQGGSVCVECDRVKKKWYDYAVELESQLKGANEEGAVVYVTFFLFALSKIVKKVSECSCLDVLREKLRYVLTVWLYSYEPELKCVEVCGKMGVLIGIIRDFVQRVTKKFDLLCGCMKMKCGLRIVVREASISLFRKDEEWIVCSFLKLLNSLLLCSEKLVKLLVKEDLAYLFEHVEHMMQGVDEVDMDVCVDGVFQMDNKEQSFVQQLASMIPVVGNVASHLIGEFMHDTPSVLLSENGNLGLTDIPKQVSSLAVSKDDYVAWKSEVFSMSDDEAKKMTSIRQRCMIPSRLGIISWDATQASGTRLSSINIHPTATGLVTESTSYWTVDSTIIGYYAQLFQFWRGGFRITIECLPSKFHQGQLFLAFNPNLLGDTAATMDACRTCTSATIDLGVNNRTAIDIPFVTWTDYLRVLKPVENVDPVSLYNCLGILRIFVQNPLDSNGTVATSIDINAYIQVLEDFEFKTLTPLDTSLQYYTNGTWQMDLELVSNVHSEGPVQVAPAGVVDRVDENAAVTVNVESATDQNVMTRWYLIQAGINVNMSDVVATAVGSWKLPSVLFSDALAASGLKSFHEFYRTDFEIMLKANPTPFNQGAIIVVWFPMNYTDSQTSFGAITQLPHAILNVSSETAATIKVPFSSIVRNMRIAIPDYGTVRVYVWNQLKAPTAAPQKMQFSMWMRANNVAIAVKKVAGLLQGDVSDTATGQATTQLAYPKRCQDGKGFINGEHDNVLTILRRPNYYATSAIPTSTATSLVYDLVSPAFCGKEHCYVLDTYLASHGTNRITVSSNVHRALSVMGLGYVKYQPGLVQACTVAEGATVVADISRSFEGASIWYLGDPHEKVFEIPWYSEAVMATNVNVSTSDTYINTWPAFYLAVNKLSTAAVQLFFWHSVGDDFHVYFPVIPHRYRVVRPALTLTEVVGIQQIENDARKEMHLVRSGDVELNPGPMVGVEFNASTLPGVERIPELLETCQDLLSKSSDLPGKMNAMMDELQTIMRPLKITIDATARLAANVEDTVSQVNWPGFFLHWKEIVDSLLDYIVHLYNVFNGGPMRMLSFLALTSKLAGHLGLDLLNKLKEVARATGVLQGPIDFATVVLLSIPIVRTLLNVWQCEMGDDEERGFLFKLKENLVGKNSISAKFIAFGETIISYIFEGTGLFVDWYKLSAGELVKFQLDVDAARVSKAYTVLSVRDSVVQLRLSNLLRMARKIKAYGPAIPRFSQSYIRSADLVIQWGSLMSAASENARVPPIGVALLGASAIGKSFLASHVLPTLLLMKTGLVQTSDQVAGQVWNKPTGSETHFYDGYKQQAITYIDDFLKSVEALDAADAINMISTSLYPLDMAAIDDKGMLFDSKFVVVSSNLTNFSAVHGLAYPQALCTRFKRAVRVTLKARGLTGAKVVEAISVRLEQQTMNVQDVAALVDEYWEFVVIDVNGGIERERISFGNFVDLIVEDFKRISVSHERIQDAMKKVTLQGDDDVYLSCNEDPIPGFGSAVGQGSAVYKVAEDILKMKQSAQNIELFHLTEAVRLLFRDDRQEHVISQMQELATSLEAEGFTAIEPVLSLGSIYFHLRDDHIVKGELIHMLRACKPIKNRRWVGLLKYLGVAAVGVGVGVVIKMLISQFSTMISGYFQGATYDGRPRSKPKVTVGGLLQGVYEKHERVRKNLRRIDMFDIDEDMSLGRMHGILLDSKTILIPNHFWQSLLKKRQAGMRMFMRVQKTINDDPTDDWLRVGFEGAMVKQVFSRSGIALDLCVVYMHNININGVRHILHFIPTEKQSEVLLSGREMVGTILHPLSNNDLKVSLGRRDPILFKDDDSEFLMVTGDLPDGCTTKAGDCGFPYLLNDSAINKPLVGMHSALCTGMPRSPVGCTPLIMEWIQKAWDSLPKACSSEVDLVPEGDKVSNKYWNPVLHTEGVTEINNVAMSAFTPTTTSKIPWLEHQDWPKLYAPSFKGVNDEVHALYTNAQKCAVTAEGIVPYLIHKRCVDHYVNKMPSDREPYVLSDEQVLNGTGVMLPIVRNTSCGFLSKWFKDGKKELITILNEGKAEQSYEFTNKASTFVVPLYQSSVIERIKQVELKCSQGIIPFMPWVATLKDELRPLAKVEAGKTRVFEQPPFEFTYLVRKYFGHFLDWIKTNPGVVTHSAIGIDKEKEWRNFYLSLRGKGQRGFDIDYSNYDGSVCSQAFDFFRDITDGYYRDKNPVRHSLLQILQYSWVIVGKQLMLTEQGNKSGNPMTDVFNSVTNVYAIYVAYITSRGNVGLELTLGDFDRDVACITYGDDVICTAEDSVLSYFNRVTVATALSRLGMKVTAASKGAELVPFEVLEELSFLKSKFKVDGAIVLAPMEEHVYLRELQFVDKRNKSDKRVQRDIVENACRFAAHNGREAFDKLVGQLASLNFGVSMLYDDFVLEVYSKQFSFA
jgi:hypothetical protein